MDSNITKLSYKDCFMGLGQAFVKMETGTKVDTLKVHLSVYV